jgi:hypothetical protein
MSDFFFQIVTDARNYDDNDTMNSLYNLKLTDMREWCEEQLDIANIPTGFFRNAFMSDMFGTDSDIPYKLWKYIQDYVYVEYEGVDEYRFIDYEREEEPESEEEKAEGS